VHCVYLLGMSFEALDVEPAKFPPILPPRDWAKSYSEFQEAIPSLYIGSLLAAKNKQKLKSEGITHILTVANKIESLGHKDQYHWMRISVLDSFDEDLLYYVKEAIDFIDEGRKNGKVLVHCHAGVSRSATIVLCYMMYNEKIPFFVAYERLKNARKVINPNPSFRRQLEIYERWLLGVTRPLPHHPPNTQPSSDPTGASGEDAWPGSMCEIIRQLEHAAGNPSTNFFSKMADKLPVGTDPLTLFTEETYSKYEGFKVREKPIYVRAQISTDSNVDLTLDLVDSNVEKALSNLSITTSEKKGKKAAEIIISKSHEKTSHKLFVWACENCSRYLFTPLNIWFLGESYYEIEHMEWMDGIEGETGILKCPNCKTDIGDYLDKQKKEEDSEHKWFSFKVEKKCVKRICLEISV